MPEQGERLERLQELYWVYLAEVQAAKDVSSPFAGAFGMKGGPADDPCHDRFVSALRALLEESAQAWPGPGEARALLEQVFAPPPEGCPRDAYWMLLAAQGLAERLIPGLSCEDARVLLERYRADYPKHARLPAQEKILRLLEKRAK